MPTIPTYSASDKSTPAILPRDVPIEDFSNLDTAGKQLGRIGQEVAVIAEYKTIVDERNAKLRASLDTADLKGTYNAVLKDKLDTIKTDPTITTPEEALAQFNKVEQQTRVDVMKRAASPYTKFALDFHTRESIAGNREEAMHIGRQKAIDYNVGKWDSVRENLLNLAASEPDPDKAAGYAQEYRDGLKKMRDGGYINEVKYQTDPIKFRDDMLDKRAYITMAGPQGPEMFRAAVRAGHYGGVDENGQWQGSDPGKISALLTAASDKDAADKRKEDQIHNENTRLVKEAWDVRAHSSDPGKKLTQVELDKAKAGDNPFITAKEAFAYEKTQLMPPNPQLDLAVHAMRQEYRSDPTITPARIATYSARANKLGEGQAQNEALSTFMGELQRDRSGAAALVNQNTNKSIKEAHGAFDDNLKQIPPAFGGKFFKGLIQNMNVAEKGELDKAIRAEQAREGNTPESIKEVGMAKIDELMKRRKEQAERVTPDKKNRSRIYE